ncbi:hypothetical protein F5B20DRAFT_307000 [Whalleya microplaca]|nr:hypothetical protein F5B20DRAFT_307000 [Whalleya microplaca]
MDNEGASLPSHHVPDTIPDLLNRLSTQDLLRHLVSRIDDQHANDHKISIPSKSFPRGELNSHQRSIQCRVVGQQHQGFNAVQERVQDIGSNTTGWCQGQHGIKTLESLVADEMHAELKALREETRLLRSYIGNCQDGNSARFPQFRRFPPEIRHMIWNFAVQGKILEVREDMCPDDNEEAGSMVDAHYEFVSRRPPPSITQVCREARAVTCGKGKLVSIQTWQPRRDAAGRATAFYLDKQWTWFDPHRDTLYLDLRCPYLCHDDAFSDLLGCVRHVTFDAFQSRHLLYSLLDRNACPQLESIDIIGAWLVQPGFSNPELEIPLFGGERHISIPMKTGDLNDAKAAFDELSLKIARSYSSLDISYLEEFFSSPVEGLLSINSSTLEIIRWKEFPKRIANRWIREYGRSEIVLDRIRRLRTMIDTSAIRRVWWLTRDSRNATGCMRWG